MSGATLEQLKVIIGAETKPLKTELEKVKSAVNSTTKSVTSSTDSIKGAFGKVAAFIASLKIAQTLVNIGKSSLQMASQVEASTQQLNRLMGESSEAFMRWGKANAQAYNMSQAEFAQYGAVYSNLLSSFIDSTDGVANQTTEVLKASSVIASATGRDISDVMERIRSGLLGNTESIEDLGINVNVAMLEATDAFKRFAGDKSWNQLDFQTQQQIRLFAILEQSTNKYGTEVLQNTNSSMGQFTAIIKDVALNIGNALLPVLNALMPVVINVANAIKIATSYFAAFMQMLFGKSASTSSLGNTTKTISDNLNGATVGADGLNDALDDTANKANKASKAMGGLMGFDELNVITSNSSSGSSGTTSGSGGVSGGSFDWGAMEDIALPEMDTSGVKKAVDKLKGIFKDLKKFLKEHKAEIIAICAGLVAGIAVCFAPTAFATISGAISGLVGVFSNFLLSVKSLGLVKTVLTGIGAALGGVSWPVVAVAAAVATLTAGIVYLYQTSESFRNLVNDTISGLFGVLSNFYNSIIVPIFDTLVDIFNTVLVPLANFIAKVVVKAVEAVSRVVLEFWKNIGVPVADFLVNILGIALQGVIDIWESWKPRIEVLFTVLNWLWDEALSPLVDFIANYVIAIFEEFGKLIEKLCPSIEEWFQGLIDFFIGVFTFDLEKAWDGIKGIFEGFTEFLSNVFGIDFGNAFGWMGERINAFLTFVKDVFGSIKTVFSGIIQFINGVFKGNWSGAWNGIVSIFKGIFQGLAGIVKQPLNAVVGIVNTVIDSINRVGFDVPDWVPVIGGKKFKINVKKIPYFANGAYVDSPTLGVFGEAGEEAVIPLERNTTGIQKIAHKLSEYMGGTASEDTNELLEVIIQVISDIDFNPTIKMDGETIAKVVNKANERINRRKGLAR